MTVVTECRSCHRVAADRARFCGGCGARLGGRADRVGPPRSAGAGTDDGLIAPSVSPRREGPPPEEIHTAPARWPAAVVLGAVLIGLMAVQALREPPPVTHEPRGYTARGEAAHTGVVSLAPLTPPEDEVWRVPSGEPAGRGFATADVGAGGIAVAGGAGLTLHDTDGAVRWHRGGRRVAEVIVAGDRVVATDGRAPVAYDAATGEQVWELPELEAAALHRVGPDVLVDAGRGVLALHDATSGERIWELRLRERLGASLRRIVAADADGVVALISRPPGLVEATPSNPLTHHLVALDRDGSVRWEIDHDRRRGAGLVGSSAMLVTHDAGGLSARRLPSREPAWSVEGLGSGGLAVIPDTPHGSVVAVAERGDGDVHTVLLGLGTGEEIARVDGTVAGLTAEAAVSVTSDEVAVTSPTGERSVSVTSDGLTATSLTGERLWRSPLMPPERPAPAVRDGLLYLAGRTGLTVRDAADGSSVRVFRAAEPWSLHPAVHPPTPAVAADTVVASPAAHPLPGGGPSLLGLGRETAVLAWTRTRDSRPPRGPMTLSGSLVYVPVADEIHGYHIASGRRAFAAKADSPRGPVAVAGDLAVAGPAPAGLVAAAPADTGDGAGDPEVVAIHRPTRLQAWRAPLPACTAPMILEEEGMVVVGTSRGVTALDAEDGARVWETDQPLPACRDLAVTDGTAVAVTGTGSVTALATADGRSLWRTEVAAITAAPSVAGDHVLVPTLAGVTAIDVADGAVAWTAPVSGGAASTPVVADGRVIVISADGELVALGD